MTATLLKPADLAKGERFETIDDARAESWRSTQLLGANRKSLATEYLSECRAGYYNCEQTYCPLCARAFRRWFIGETLRIVDQCGGPSLVMTVLLAKSRNIGELDPGDYRQKIRHQLTRAGLEKAEVIGGFEIVYRARDKSWILHVNLLVLGYTELAINAFEKSLASTEFSRPVKTVPLKNDAEQLSYLLKFTTYHRPLVQSCSKRRSPAKPLNRREHVVLVTWMSRNKLADMMFLHGVRREGSRLKLTREFSRSGSFQQQRAILF
jgi:hypothetical protein